MTFLPRAKQCDAENGFFRSGIGWGTIFVLEKTALQPRITPEGRLLPDHVVNRKYCDVGAI
jgi:hypothetical protein